MEQKLSLSGGASWALALLLGLAACLVALLLTSLLAAAVIYFSPLNEQLLPGAALMTDGLSILVGGFVAAKSGGRRGLLLGAALALLVLLLMLPLGSTVGVALPLKTAVCLLSGMAGGVLGLN